MTEPQRPDEPLLREQAGAVATLRLNRPKQFNALSESLLDALAGEIDSLRDDAETLVVILAANGRAFSAGHDLRELREHPDEPYYQDLFSRCSSVMQGLLKLPQPVIAQVHGIATAAGCQMVASCDLAVAGASARFATSGINLGLFCATPSVAVTRSLAPKHAFEMLFTGDFVDAPTAASIGLINRVVPDESLAEEVQKLAAHLAEKPPAALRSGKRLFYEQRNLPIDRAYQLAGDTMAADILEADAIEGIDAFLEKRDPRWGHR